MKLRFLLALVAVASVAAKPIDDLSPAVPAAGDHALHVLSPSLLALSVVTAPAPGEKPPPLPGRFLGSDFRVEVDGVRHGVESIGFKRRVVYAPLRTRDLRVLTEVFLQLREPLPQDGEHKVSVHVRESPLWPAGRMFEGTTASRRISPAIHVNQVGYTTGLPKVGFVGYSLGTLGEMPVPADAGFRVVDARTGEIRHEGELRQRRDVGFTLTPRPYQSVYEADFTGLDASGEYQLMVPGLGASLPFHIGDGALLAAVRTYALGLFHQRCGFGLHLPHTRFTHDACHTAAAEIPMPAARFEKAWEIIRKLDQDEVKPTHPELQLKLPEDMHYPFKRHGTIDVSGGHHDAGDYSKYTTNSAMLVHILMFAVDSFPGVAELDNLGLPESGDGIPDLLQEAKWESDFLSRLQDEDGGFYFLVYPRDRRYETDVLPDRGDTQIVWPKTTASTAAAVAALAQCASSPVFQRHFPEIAKRYRKQAEHGWQFLMQAIARYGRWSAYQRLTHYGDEFNDTDELAWAAAELFLATGNPDYEKKLLEWYPDPDDAQTRRYGWRRATAAYGNVLRSYAFSPSSGRLPREKLAAAYFAKCEAELRRAGEDAARWSEQNAYGTSYPEASKRRATAGWYFSNDEAFDITVAHQLQRRPAFVHAVLDNLNYEFGANPVNRVYVTGAGWRRQHEIVHQYAQNDDRMLPPSGIPIGNLQSAFSFLSPYKTELRDQSWPADDGNPPYPLYDRWSDAYNWSTEFVITNQARALASLAYWAAQTPAAKQPWKAATARIAGPTGTLPLYKTATFRLESGEVDLAEARIVWEARGQEPAFGATYAVTPRASGPQWVEAEATLPDGRRVFARATFNADAPVVLWVNGSLPRGAKPYVQNGDSWTWIKAASKPPELSAHINAPQHESALAAGIHEHGFADAEDTLSVQRGDVLFAYVFIDPKNIPATIMLEWNDGSHEHRAYWGRNEIPYGRHGTAGQRPMGKLPPAGRWVRLEVPAAAVGLEGRTVKGMVFRLHGGRARWDAAGKMSGAAKRSGTVVMPEP